MTKKSTSPKTIKTPIKQTNIAVVIALIERPTGATLEELGEATDWQQHSIRAALTGLRNKGHVIERSKRGKVTCYCIAEDAKCLVLISSRNCRTYPIYPSPNYARSGQHLQTSLPRA